MSFELIILEGPQAGRRLPIGDSAVTFGRSVNALLSFPSDNFMSGLHLTAQAGPDGLLLSDPRSTNGTFLNGERISSAVARVGDVIRIGSLTMRVALPGSQSDGVVLLSSIPHSVGPFETRALSLPGMADTLPAPPSKPAAMPATKPSGAPSNQANPVILPQRHAGVLEALRGAPGPLYCLLDAAADEMVPALLSMAAEQMQIRCLYDGDSAVTLARWAPYLVELPVGSALLGVLVDKGWGKGWASYFTAAATFEDLRKHFRKFLMVQIESGKEVYFRFYDPRVLRDFLPLAAPNEIASFCGPVDAWMVEAEDPGAMVVLRSSSGGLISEIKPIAADISQTTA